MRRERGATQQQGGFSLVELMIALLLGLLLMSGIIAVYLEGKNNFVQDEAISRVQENGRFALRLLSREIAMGGFYGGVTDPTSITSPAVSDCKTGLLNPDQIVETYNKADGGETSAFNSCFPAAITGVDTDILAVRRASDRPVILHGQWQTGFSELTPGQYYLHTDNSGLGLSEIKLGSVLTPGIGTLVATGSTADVWDYFGRIYYIGTENGIPSLCVRSVEDIDQTCLVNGIESLQLELGVDTSGDGIPDEFISGAVNSSGGVDVTTVVSMRIHLLVRSLAPVRNFAAQTRSWVLGDQALTTNDQYYRRVFTTTVPRNNQVFTTFE